MTAPGPIARYRLETTDPEQAHTWLTEFYTAHVPRLSGDRDAFRMRLAGQATDLLRVEDVRHTMNLDADVTGYDALVVVRVRSGRFWIRSRNGAVGPGPGELVLLDTSRPGRGGWDTVDMQAVRLDLGAARALAAEVSGVPAQRIRFGTSNPVDRTRARYWADTVHHVVHDVLDHDDVAAHPLVRANAFRMLAGAALSTFPNTALDALADRPVQGSWFAQPAAVRRAVAFVESAAHRDIGPAEIAEAARIGVRGLQHAFRRHLGCTPMQYVRRVRMSAAHRDLCHGDPSRGETVAGVATRWGFTHPGRFAVEYRRVYGCSPRETLHR